MEKLEQEATDFYEDMIAKVELVESETITPFRINQLSREERIARLMGTKSGLFEDLQHQHQISVRRTLADMACGGDRLKVNVHPIETGSPPLYRRFHTRYLVASG